MEKLGQNAKEKLISGFEVFLEKHLRPGELSEIVDWMGKHGNELNSRFPLERSGSYSDPELRELFELMSVNYGGLTNVEDQKEIFSELLDCGISKGRTLSIGCGLAPHELYLISQGLIAEEFVGVDTSENMLKRTRGIAQKEGITNVSFVQNYGSDIEYDNEFQQVFLIDALAWMRSWKQCLIKSAKALENNGTIFISHSIYSPVVQINPLEIIKTLAECRVDVKKVSGMDGHAGTPRSIIFGKKEQASGFIIPG